MLGALANRGWRWPMALLALCAGLAVALAAILARDAPVGSDLAAAAAPSGSGSAARLEADPPPEPFRMPPAHAFSNVTDRPLFHSSRRPVVGAGPASKDPVSADKPDLLLRGTIVVADGTRIALVEADGTHKTVRLGGEVKGWVVTTVEPDRMVMENGEAQAVYSLDETLRKAATAPKDKRVEQRRRGRAERRERPREVEREVEREEEIEDDAISE